MRWYKLLKENNGHLHSMASTRLGVTILTLAQHLSMITQMVNSISLTGQREAQDITDIERRLVGSLAR